MPPSTVTALTATINSGAQPARPAELLRQGGGRARRHGGGVASNSTARSTSKAGPEPRALWHGEPEAAGTTAPVPGAQGQHAHPENDEQNRRQRQTHAAPPPEGGKKPKRLLARRKACAHDRADERAGDGSAAVSPSIVPLVTSRPPSPALAYRRRRPIHDRGHKERTT